MHAYSVVVLVVLALLTSVVPVRAGFSRCVDGVLYDNCTLVDGTLDAGPHEVVWDGKDAVGRDVSSGVYLYRLVTPSRMITRRMTLVR